MLLALIAALALMPSVAMGAGCPDPDADTTYLGNCGPALAVPAWSDAGGFTDPSQYSTIRLADVNGDGTDELLGRNHDGLEVFWFDTSIGQWRPQVDANDVRQLVSAQDANGTMVSDFASPTISDESDPHRITLPYYYSTIQAADIDGRPGEEILARFWDGMRVYKYVPPAGGKSIDGGTWQRIGTGGPFSDSDGWGDPSRYQTIITGDVDGTGASELLGRSQSGLVGYRWTGSAWSPLPVVSGGADPFFSDSACGQPSCFGLFRTGTFYKCPSFAPNCPGGRLRVAGRTGSGVDLEHYESPGVWEPDPPSADLAIRFGGIFGDLPGGPDCFVGSTDCLGSSPSYYETFGVTDFDHNGIDDLYARQSDGLQVRTPLLDSGANYSLATLSDLAGEPSAIQPGEWGSIRTGNIDGVGGPEVLALDGQGLQAWSYNTAAEAWNKLQPPTPLALGADPWLTHPEYYSTIQTGDVDGDGRDDVVARGPTGIRTWFYNRPGSASPPGWQRYQPAGYPDFPASTCPAGVTGPCGQAAAYAAFLLGDKGKGKTVRPTWASVTQLPQTGDFDAALGELTLIGACQGQPIEAEPTTYASCTKPDTLPTYTTADWTAVVNQLFAEQFWAVQAQAHFKDVDTIRTDVLPANQTALSAIYQQLNLQAAAQNANPTQFGGASLWSLITGIAGSVAGLVQPELGAGLSTASFIFAALPSSQVSAMDTFSTTYSDLSTQFATMVGDMLQAEQEQVQSAYGDQGLLTLIGQMRVNGTWKPDTVGMESAANQGFAAWAYQNLMPTLYHRYSIQGCQNGSISNFSITCPDGTPPSGPGVVPAAGGANFTTIAQPYTRGSTPCLDKPALVPPDNDIDCTFNLPPSNLMSQIWGPLTPACSYVPGEAATKWVFGSCSAGVDVNTSIGDNTWNFPSHSGTPVYITQNNAVDPPSTTARAAATGARTPVVLGRPRLGRRPAVPGRARFVTVEVLPASLKLSGATFTLNRLLFERPGRGELLRPRGLRIPRQMTLRRTGAGRFAATATANRRRVHVTLRRLPDGRTRVRLTARAPRFRTPRICEALPARFGLRTPNLRLESLLTISDGDDRFRRRLPHELRCARDRAGNVNRLVAARTQRSPVRSGLTLSVRGPRQVQPGSTVTYVVRLQNRRGGKRRMGSSVWDIVLYGGQTNQRIRELRRGRARTVIVTERVPLRVGQRFCTTVVATAPDMRAAEEQSVLGGAGGPARVHRLIAEHDSCGPSSRAWRTTTGVTRSRSARRSRRPTRRRWRPRGGSRTSRCCAWPISAPPTGSTRTASSARSWSSGPAGR